MASCIYVRRADKTSSNHREEHEVAENTIGSLGGRTMESL